MKVYALIGGWDYEGYSEPDGIFSTKELAEEAKKKVYQGYDFLEIHEFELDQFKEWKWK